MAILEQQKISFVETLDRLSIAARHHHVDNDVLRTRLEDDWSGYAGRSGLAIEQCGMEDGQAAKNKQRTAEGSKHRNLPDASVQ